MRMGIDWGGTKMEIIALDDAGQQLLRRRVSTPQNDYAACVRAARDLVLGVEAELGERGSVGFGIPGTVSPATGLVKNANSTWLNGKPLDRDLEEALARPVRVANDANCLALSESVDGAGADAPIVFAVIIGTGTGSGIAVNKKVLSGRHLISGEWGHNPLPWPQPEELPGPSCFCGRSGCIERWVSGSGIAADHMRVTGRTMRAEAIIEAFHAGEPEASATYRRYVGRLGRALAHVVNLLDPDVIILGGGMGKVKELYDDLPGLVGPFVFSDVFTTPIVPPVHLDSSGVRGAAWLWGNN